MSDLYLYDDKPWFIKKHALALRDNLGIRTLTSLDSRCYYQENLSEAKEICIKLQSSLRQADLKRLCQIYNLPHIALERMVYHDILVQVVHYLDLNRRIQDYLDHYPVERICFVGVGWKKDLLSDICQKRGLCFIHQASLLSKFKVLARKALSWAKTMKKQTADAVDQKADFLFLMPIHRLARGLDRVIEELGREYCVQLVVESDVNEYCQKNVAGLYSFFERNSCSTAQEVEKLCEQMPCWGEKNVLARVIAQLFIKTMVDQLQLASALSRLLQDCPKAIVVASFVGESLLEVARAMDRTTVVIQTCGTVEYNVHLAGDNLYLLASEQDKKNVLNSYSMAKVEVCGHITYDNYPQMDVASVSKMRQTLLASQYDKLLLFVGSYAIPGFVEWESIAARSEMFLQAVSTLENICVVMKLHPYEHHLAEYNAMLDKFAIHHVIITQTMDIGLLVQASDAVVMLESTVGQESIVRDKPLLDIPVNTDCFGYRQSEASLVAHDEKEVKASVLEMLYDDKTQLKLREGRCNYLATYFPKQDGLVVSRICHELKSLK